MMNSQRADAQILNLDPELAEKHKHEYCTNVKKHRLLSDIVVLAATGGTAAKIVHDSKNPKTKGLMAAFTNQFKPLMDLFKENDKKSIPILEFIPKAIWQTCKSIPRIISIPTAILIGLTTISVVENQNRINTKYDTINTIKHSNLLSKD